MRGGKSKGFPGMGGGNMQQLLKQAQKMQTQMQEDMAKLQEEMKTRTVNATVGGGAIEVVFTGEKKLQSIVVKPEVVDPDDVEMLQDLLLAAINEGLRKATEMYDSEMEKISGNLKMPGGLF
ncbi:Nucleoid-associated protein [bioreactor metagenome]|uniref:Nucleoid-associated protein n=1 Tax=bioreactor metagenome TaxID=1076179 RepID=A0A644YRT3_9ZZZZ